MASTKYKGQEITKGSRRYIWCAYYKKYLPERMFYNNASTSTGKGRECIPVAKMRNSKNKKSLKEIIATLPSKEKKMFVTT